ncbi:MAG: THUMP domain-containing protein [Nitrososphaeria archaeon]|nr:THUMP domain-containing protein [Nitrososphaeria archaeon]
MDVAEYDVIVVHYGEVTLKRGKRGLYERILMNNLRKVVGLPVKRLQGRYVIELTHETELDDVLSRVGKVFGVVWYAPAIKANSIEELKGRLAEILKDRGTRRIKIETRRSDKSFPMTSLEISKRIGEYLASSLGLKIDLKSPEERILVEITSEGIYASLQKLRGPGGLPVGSSGKVLGLFSGGPLSLIACWYMMKRGCVVDVLHVSGGEFFQSKEYDLFRKLLEYSLEFKLYLIPSTAFRELSIRIPEKLREQAFKLYLLMLGEAVARRGRHLGLVWGYNAALNPSGLEEFCAITQFRSLPSYAPLISLSGQEVFERARYLGIDLAPTRRDRFLPNMDELEKLSGRYGLETIVDSSLKFLEVFKLRRGEEPRRIWPKGS